MPKPSPVAARAAIDRSDPLLAHTLRAAFESYIRGDYESALNLLLDAQAFSRERADTVPLIALASTLGDMLLDGQLTSTDVTAAPDPAAIRHVSAPGARA